MTLATGEVVFYTGNTATSVEAMSTGNSLHNNCWTVVHGLTGATTTKRVGISGIFGSNQTCLRTIVDGYSLSGIAAISVAGSNYNSAVAQTVNAESPMKLVNTIKYSVWKALVPYTTDISAFPATASGAVPANGVNVGSPVAIY